jgi:hypothetical protein
MGLEAAAAVKVECCETFVETDREVMEPAENDRSDLKGTD